MRCLYRILFVLYAEARGLLPLDMLPTGTAMPERVPGAGTRAFDPATDPRRNPLAAQGFFEATCGLCRAPSAGADLGPEGRIPRMAVDSSTRSRVLKQAARI